MKFRPFKKGKPSSPKHLFQVLKARNVKANQVAAFGSVRKYRKAVHN